MAFNIHVLVDRSPEFPFYILAVVYLFGTEMSVSIHVFSVLVLFMLTSLVVGLLLKTSFRTRRPSKRYNLPMLRYDFPSLHSMISMGTIAFVYYVNSVYATLFIPVGLFYLYSRLKLKAHSLIGVLGGALIGVTLGFSFGVSMWEIHLPEAVEVLLSILLFCTPMATVVFRLKYSEKIED